MKQGLGLTFALLALFIFSFNTPIKANACSMGHSEIQITAPLDDQYFKDTPVCLTDDCSFSIRPHNDSNNYVLVGAHGKEYWRIFYHSESFIDKNQEFLISTGFYQAHSLSDAEYEKSFPELVTRTEFVSDPALHALNTILTPDSKDLEETIEKHMSLIGSPGRQLEIRPYSEADEAVYVAKERMLLTCWYEEYARINDWAVIEWKYRPYCINSRPLFASSCGNDDVSFPLFMLHLLTHRDETTLVYTVSLVILVVTICLSTLNKSVRQLYKSLLTPKKISVLVSLIVLGTNIIMGSIWRPSNSVGIILFVWQTVFYTAITYVGINLILHLRKRNK